VIGFNVPRTCSARKLAEGSGVQIRYYNIIYDAVDDVKAALSACSRPSRRKSGWGWRGARGLQRSRRSAPSPAACAGR